MIHAHTWRPQQLVGRSICRLVHLVLCWALLTPLLSTTPAAEAQTAPNPGPIGVRAITPNLLQVRVNGVDQRVRLGGLEQINWYSAQYDDALLLVDRAISGQPLRLDSCGAEPTDGQPPLRQISVLDAQGAVKQWVNEDLVTKGLARVVPTAQQPENCDILSLLTLQAKAQEAGVGRWSPVAASLSKPTTPVPSHDWRRPGFPSIVGGQLYDSACVPMRSVGTNVPNLPFRNGLEENLEWMRHNKMRWMRVFAPAHGPSSATWAPRDVASATVALRAFLARVEAFNAQHPTSEWIYVLVSLTNYYPPGVPGDRYAFDNNEWSEAPVLAAPWYRPGVRSYDFNQAHGTPKLTDLPNYEVHYKPWVQQLVGGVSRSPALLGWQLGNELKARGNLANDITPAQAFDWYMAFSADMVDSIRDADPNHLVFMGAQYLAELADWDYRPGGEIDADRVWVYNQLMRKTMNACGRYCWNVWSLTSYDFNVYSIDDSSWFAQFGVASIMTEYGFTRGSEQQMMARYGGDRPRALKTGRERRWTDLNGVTYPREWGALDLVKGAQLNGIAPWGAAAPEPYSGADADNSRGITGAPDEASLWAAWRDISTQLEAANRAAGPSRRCLATQSAIVPATDTQAALTPSVSPFCTVGTRGNFGRLLDGDSVVRQRLGCPRAEERTSPILEQLFERGLMQWRPDTGQVLVSVFGDGKWSSYDGEYVASDVEATPVPPPGLFAPRQRFLRIWRDDAQLAQRLGWAVGPERTSPGALQDFTSGMMVATGVDQRLVRIYYADGTTTSTPDLNRPW